MRYPEIGEIVQIKDGPFASSEGIIQEKIDDRTYMVGVTVFGRLTSFKLTIDQFDYSTFDIIEDGPCPGIRGREYERVISGKYAFWIKLKKENGKLKTRKEMQKEADTLRKSKA